MNNNPVLDDDLLVQNNREQLFPYLYEKYVAAAKLANRWETMTIVLVLVNILLFFAYHLGIQFIWQIPTVSFWILFFVSTIAYFLYFFAIQQRVTLAYLFPNKPNVEPKIYNVWILLGLAAIFHYLAQFGLFSEENILHHIIWLLANLITIHLCCTAIQQLLLKKYQTYLFSIWQQSPFPTIGYFPALCFLMGIVLFVVSFFVAWASVSGRGHPELEIWASLSFFASVINFFLTFAYIALHIQAEKHKLKEAKV